MGLAMLPSAARLAGRVEARLAELGLKVPEAAAPAANYVPFTRSGKLLFISGQIPKNPDNSLLKGTLGASCTVEQGQAAARLCGLHLVGQMKAACGGDLDKVKKVLKVEGFVSCAPDFEQHPQDSPWIPGIQGVFVMTVSDSDDGQGWGD
ncbi:unnamed protein product [Effrenium voratum]|uniref:Endoribonuclease L-PSP/chorismate mutase-like domain-containing protein n=1 Tax=Effrenium voratum TaxID=2562239 RepID=A0AA36JH19_9DINO|nr:unnamed protein product [Effrenium voratum]